MFDGRELRRLAVLASGVQFSCFIILDSTSYSYICTFNFYFESQVLERSMGLHTCAIITIRLDYKLAISTAREKKVCQKVL